MKFAGYLLGIVFLMSNSVGLSGQSTNDLKLISDRYIKDMTSSLSPALKQSAAQIAGSESANGSFSGVNYSDRSPGFATAQHLSKTRILAMTAYNLRLQGTPDTGLEAKALTALRYWLKADYQSTNWWWNQISVPQLIGQIALYLRPSLNSGDMQAIDKVLARGQMQGMTGENLIWTAEVQLLRSLLSQNPQYADQSFKAIFSTLKRVPPVLPNGQPGEGILEDSSFHQHGHQLYSGAYGLAFANDAGRFALFSWGTSFQISADDLATYESYLLDGEAWMIRGTTFDFSAVGRQISWTYSPNGKALLKIVQQLSALQVPRQAELAAFASRMAQGDSAAPLNGTRIFWDSDYVVHRRSAYMTSVRMFSTRTSNSEMVNGEGLKSAHLGDGTNFLYLTGNEYNNIFPVWDWTLIPGTTAVHAVDSKGLPETFEQHTIGQVGLTSFVGGVTDKQYGVATLALQRGPLSAQKAWFFFDDFYVCLGSGIQLSNTPASAQVATDVNQTLLNGSVYTSATKTPLASGTHSFSTPSSGPGYVFHDNVGYLLAPNTRAVVSNQAQQGKWSDIGAGSSNPVSTQVFNLWIDHGASPQNANYSYAVFPNTTLTAMDAARSQLPYSVLQNTPNVQGVYVDSLHRASLVFRTPGKINTPLGAVQVDKPCILMLVAQGGKVVVTASDPTQSAITLNVSVNSRTTSIRFFRGESRQASL